MKKIKKIKIDDKVFEETYTVRHINTFANYLDLISVLRQ